MVLAILLLLRRRVFINAFNRRMAGLLLAGIVASAINRLNGANAGIAPGIILGADLLIVGVINAAGAITVLPALWANVAIAGVGLALLQRWPSYPGPIVTAVAVGTLLTVAMILRKGGAASRPA